MTLARSAIVGPSLGGQNVCASWRGGCMVRSLRSLGGAWRFPVLVAVGVMVASSCSSSSSAGGGAITPAATIFVQNFRYNGVPTTLSSGILTFLFENKESFPITHEMIPIALPAGKTAQ